MFLYVLCCYDIHLDQEQPGEVRVYFSVHCSPSYKEAKAKVKKEDHGGILFNPCVQPAFSYNSGPQAQVCHRPQWADLLNHQSKQFLTDVTVS